MTTSPAASITVILVDDEKLASDELAYLLKGFPGRRDRRHRVERPGGA